MWLLTSTVYMCVWATCIYQLSIHVCLNYKSALYTCMAEVFISTVYMYGWSFYQHLIQVWRKYYQHCIHVWLNYLSALFTCMAVVLSALHTCVTKVLSALYTCVTERLISTVIMFGWTINGSVYMCGWTMYHHCAYIWLNYFSEL